MQDNKNMIKSHKKEMKELTEHLEEKLKVIREENRKSKNTFKELIVSRETELVRINKEIDSFKREQEDRIK